MSTTVSLWPDDLISAEPLSTPAKIVREQADLLDDKTGGLLVGQVEPVRDRNGELTYTFAIHVPELHYSFELFDISHGPTVYPTKIEVDERVAEEAFPESLDDDPRYRPAINVKSEDELREALGRIFSASFTRRIVQGLHAQAKEERERNREGQRRRGAPPELDDDVPF
ncbi:hypothetical protein [Alienimonas sp. DA493]|uniref:hypothetical protein n=1 Tax=Alienimonas sp. DA493 TaxID=3373605 RepID=UPI003754BE75